MQSIYQILWKSTKQKKLSKPFLSFRTQPYTSTMSLTCSKNCSSMYLLDWGIRYSMNSCRAWYWEARYTKLSTATILSDKPCNCSDFFKSTIVDRWGLITLSSSIPVSFSVCKIMLSDIFFRVVWSWDVYKVLLETVCKPDKYGYLRKVGWKVRFTYKIWSKEGMHCVQIVVEQFVHTHYNFVRDGTQQSGHLQIFSHLSQHRQSRICQYWGPVFVLFFFWCISTEKWILPIIELESSKFALRVFYQIWNLKNKEASNI